MRTLVVIAAFVASLVGCGGPEPSPAPAPSAGVEVGESSLTTTTQTYRGSYLCGADWWHVQQIVKVASINVRNAPADIHAQLPAIWATDDPTANAVQLWCWSDPVAMPWGGQSYYNAAGMGGSPSNCIMWSHRRNQHWQNSATVAVNPGGLQLYAGAAGPTWEFQVLDAGGSGNHDGLAACGGSFLLFLQ